MVTTIQWENRNEAKWMKKIKEVVLFSFALSLPSFSVVRWTHAKIAVFDAQIFVVLYIYNIYVLCVWWVFATEGQLVRSALEHLSVMDE